jgi:ethanolamine utilization microcompartment shell protein EutL
LDATPELLKKVAWESAGVKLTVKKEDLTDCTNPRKIVETYKVQGGPAPSEVKKSIKTCVEIMEQNTKNIAKLKNNQDDAKGKLDNVIESYCVSNSENVRFKNPNL